jgi:hypothetical protein
MSLFGPGVTRKQSGVAGGCIEHRVRVWGHPRNLRDDYRRKVPPCQQRRSQGANFSATSLASESIQISFRCSLRHERDVAAAPAQVSLQGIAATSGICERTYRGDYAKAESDPNPTSGAAITRHQHQHARTVRTPQCSVRAILRMSPRASRPQKCPASDRYISSLQSTLLPPIVPPTERQRMYDPATANHIGDTRSGPQ